MDEPDWKGPLGEALGSALKYLEGLPARPVGSSASVEELRAALGGPLPEAPSEPREVIAALAAAAEPGLVATPSGRFFGFVIGGAAPAALAADWLTAAWDQNAGLSVLGPAAAVTEQVTGGWLAELLGLPAEVSVGFVTGVQQANFTALAAARHETLRRVGWNVETDGLAGAPRLRVLAGQDRHTPSTGRCGSSGWAAPRSPRSRWTGRGACARRRCGRVCARGADRRSCALSSHHLAWPGGHADLGDELVDRRG